MPTEIVAADVNDQIILSKTRQINEDNTVQFRYELPSGRTLCSEKFKRDLLKPSVLVDWCNIVRNQMEADAQNERDQVRQRVMAEKRERQTAILDAMGTPMMSAGISTAISPQLRPAITAPDAAASMLDPGDFIAAQIAQAREALERMEWTVQEALSGLATAKANLQKWEVLAASFAANSPERKRARKAKTSEIRATSGVGVQAAVMPILDAPSKE